MATTDPSNINIQLVPDAQNPTENKYIDNAVPHLLFMYATYTAVVFVLVGWIMLIMTTLEVHKAARTGELLNADCQKGYLELETAQSYALKAYLSGKCRDKLQTALSFVKIGLAFLCGGLFFSLLYPLTVRLKELGWKPKETYFIVGWIIAAAWTFSSMVSAVAVTNNKKVTNGFTISAIVISIALFYSSKYMQAGAGFYKSDNMFISRNIWIIALVLGGCLWIASTIYFKKIDNMMLKYVTTLNKLQTQLLDVDEYYLLAHLGKNYESSYHEQIAPDDPPNARTIKSILKAQSNSPEDVWYSPEAPLYVMHMEGRELQDVELRLKDEYRGRPAEDIDDMNSELKKVMLVRSTMKKLRESNAQFNKDLSYGTGLVIGMSLAVIIMPVFVLYTRRIAPAIFGV